MRLRNALSTAAVATIATAIVVAGCSMYGTSGVQSPTSRSGHAAAPFDVPSPTPTPIQLAIAGLIGTPTWPNHDTATGGQGQQVAGLNCLAQLSEPFHHHVQLSIFVNGQQLTVPMGVGMFQPGSGKSGYIYHTTCLYFVHTHDRTGIIHIESKVDQPYTLGTFFKLWGEPLTSTQIAQFTGPVSIYINGTLDTTDPIASVPLTGGSDITLVIGTPPAWIPAYILPPSLSP
ncbi:MAG TPA: hypothetical protein VFO25_07605 [Candidatus Eremiobacteraceae bacterium]|nr:hypothetical protein [Candidatus Eremiobacteraceae bacterium]